MSTMTTSSDAWSKHSAKYNSRSGESFSTALIRAACQEQWFAKLDKTIAQSKKGPIKVLLLACGTGAELRVLCERYSEKDMTILATDFAEGMVKATQKAIEDLGKQSMASTKVIDAMNITEADKTFDVVFLVLGPMLMPDPGKVFREIQRVLVPSGWSAYLTVGHMEVHDILSEAKRGVLASSGRLQEYRSFYDTPIIANWGAPEVLAKKLEEAGFTDVQSQLVASFSSVQRGQGIDDMLTDLYDNPGMNNLYLGNLSQVEGEAFKELSRRLYHERWPVSQAPALARPYATAMAACAHRN